MQGRSRDRAWEQGLHHGRHGGDVQERSRCRCRDRKPSPPPSPPPSPSPPPVPALGARRHTVARRFLPRAPAPPSCPPAYHPPPPAAPSQTAPCPRGVLRPVFGPSAQKALGLKREDYYVVTKLLPDDHGCEHPRPACPAPAPPSPSCGVPILYSGAFSWLGGNTRAAEVVSVSRTVHPTVVSHTTLVESDWQHLGNGECLWFFRWILGEINSKSNRKIRCSL